LAKKIERLGEALALGKFAKTAKQTGLQRLGQPGCMPSPILLSIRSLVALFGKA